MRTCSRMAVGGEAGVHEEGAHLLLSCQRKPPTAQMGHWQPCCSLLCCRAPPSNCVGSHSRASRHTAASCPTSNAAAPHSRNTEKYMLRGADTAFDAAGGQVSPAPAPIPGFCSCAHPALCASTCNLVTYCHYKACMPSSSAPGAPPAAPAPAPVTSQRSARSQPAPGHMHGFPTL